MHRLRCPPQEYELLAPENFLSENRKRVISLAGTSLIHHIDQDDQLKLAKETGNLMQDDGVLMSAIVTNRSAKRAPMKNKPPYPDARYHYDHGRNLQY